MHVAFGGAASYPALHFFVLFSKKDPCPLSSDFLQHKQHFITNQPLCSAWKINHRFIEIMWRINLLFFLEYALYTSVGLAKYIKGLFYRFLENKALGLRTNIWSTLPALIILYLYLSPAQYKCPVWVKHLIETLQYLQKMQNNASWTKKNAWKGTGESLVSLNFLCMFITSI